MAKKATNKNGKTPKAETKERNQEAGLVNLTDAQVDGFFERMRATMDIYIDEIIEANVSIEARKIPDVVRVYQEKHAEKFKFLLTFMAPRNVKNDTNLGRRVRRSDNRDEIMKLL